MYVRYIVYYILYYYKLLIYILKNEEHNINILLPILLTFLHASNETLH